MPISSPGASSTGATSAVARSTSSDSGQAPIAIECKWSGDDFDPAGHRAFRAQYPSGDNYVVVRDASRALRRRFGDLTVAVVPLATLIRALSG